MININEARSLEIHSLVDLVEVVEALRVVNSVKIKESILKEYKDNEDLKLLLYYVYNPHIKFGVSEDKLTEIENNTKYLKGVFDFGEFNNFLNTLALNNINDKLRAEIGLLLNSIDNEQLKDLVRCILIKDLKAGLGAKTVDKVFKGLLPKHEVQLAKKYEPGKTKLKGTFFITEKLDGIRCTIYIQNGEIVIKTRQGKDITGLVQIEEVILRNIKDLENFALDGELLSIGSSPQDVYKHTMEKVQNKNDIKTGIEFRVFDAIRLNDFLEKKNIEPYWIRRSRILSIFANEELLDSPFINPVPLLYSGEDESVIMGLLDLVVSQGKEGLMINLDKPYEFKRTSNLLKVKKMHTMDLKIIGFEEGTGKNKNNLGALVVDFKGNSVGVGSGLSDDLRREIWDNQNKYINRIVEIQYFEVSKDKNGIESLRFPVFKTFREEGKEISYF